MTIVGEILPHCWAEEGKEKISLLPLYAPGYVQDNRLDTFEEQD
ncbi:MAG: hypothetical protein NZL98_03465 [Anaerolineales bacterium]|nr:hypothetical protein [Anaerolineales bacterium]